MHKLSLFFKKINVLLLIMAYLASNSCPALENQISPKSIFSELFEGDVDTVYVLMQSLALLKGEQTKADFKRNLRARGLENDSDECCKIEESKSSLAVRFKGKEAGKWYRISGETLGSSDPELGFLIPKATQAIDEFTLETFEKTVSVGVLSKGIGFGVVVKIENDDFLGHQAEEKSEVNVAEEQEKLKRALDLVAADLSKELDSAKDEKEIEVLGAELGIVTDTYEFTPALTKLISPTVDAKEALKRFIQDRAKFFLAMSEPQFQFLGTEMLHIGQRLIDVLGDVNRKKALDDKIAHIARNGQKVILVGDILPYHFSLENIGTIAGMIIDQDEPASHNSVRANGLGIPYARNAGQIPSLTQQLREGDTVALEMMESESHATATITLEPEPSERNRILRKMEERKKYHRAVETMKSATRDGHFIPLHLNFSIGDDIAWKQKEFHHIGLARSDFTYTDTREEPTAEALVAKYSEFFEKIGKAGIEEVNFRTFDLDLGDKAPAFFTNEGKREGIDFSLNDTQGLAAFETQVRAVFMGLASQLAQSGRPGGMTKLSLLFPKVRTIDEFRRAAEIVNRIHEELKDGDADYDRIKFKLGIMVETKEALENIDSFIGEVDFINVGTNDLTLSLFSDKVYRKNPQAGKVPLQEYNHRILGALERIVRAAQAHPNPQRRPPICVCGALASYVEYSFVLLGLGYPGLSLSMPYDKVLDLKVNIAAHDSDVIKQYSTNAFSMVHKAENLKGRQAESVYAELKKYLSDKLSEIQETSLEYLTYEWANMTLSLDQLIQVIGRVMDAIDAVNSNIETEISEAGRIALGKALLDEGILAPNLYEKFIRKKWDYQELLSVLEIWAYRQLIDQGTFYVYRAMKMGNDHWIRVFPTGEEFRWKSRYECRIVKEGSNVKIQLGPDRFVDAEPVVLDGDSSAEVYRYKDGDEIFFARNMDVGGVPYTFVKAGPEKEHVIRMFRKGKAIYGQHEKLYRDKSNRVQIIHSPDWMKHPILSKMPYATGKINRSVLYFMIDDDPVSGEITWGQNMARPGYGHLFEDNSRVLGILVDELKLVDLTVRKGREAVKERLGFLTKISGLVKEIETLKERNRQLEEEGLAKDERIQALEKLLREIGVSEAVIKNPALFDHFDRAA